MPLSLRVLLATTLLVLASGAAGQYVAGFADPNRNVNMYVFAADPLYSATSLPGKLYVFRQGSTLDSPAIPGQGNILTAGDGRSPDIRQIVIVEEPSGTIATEIRTEAGIGGRTTHAPSNLFCHCPLRPSGFQYGDPAHAARYPLVQNAWFGNTGTAAEYIDFGVVSTAAPGVLYRQRDPQGNVLAYLADNIPADTTYTPVRLLKDVTVSAAASSVAALAGIPTTDVGYFNSPVVEVLGSDTTAEVIALHEGWHAGQRLEYYEFAGGRLASSVALHTGVRFAKMYLIDGQTEPVVSTTAGQADYSDLWLIVRVAPTVLPPPQITRVADIPTAWTRTVTGTYRNCPIVNADTRLANPTHATPAAVFYDGQTKFCINMDFYGPPPGCALRGSYQLVRAGDRTVVTGNDIFTQAPFWSVEYSAMTWVMPFVVPQQYATSTFTTVPALTSAPEIAAETGTFANRVVVTQPPTELFPYEETVLTGRDYLHVAWSFPTANKMRIRLTCRDCYGFAAIGFAFPETRGHEGYFVAGFFSQDGVPCVRKLIGSSLGASGLTDAIGNELNVTNATLTAAADGMVSFTFTRDVTVASEAFSNFSVDLMVQQRVMFATRRQSPLSCTAAPTTFVHDASSDRPQWSWGQNLTGTAPPSEAPPSVFTAAPPMVVTTGFNVSTYVGYGSYRMDSLYTMSWNISIPQMEITFTFRVADQYAGWVGFGFGAQMAGADMMTAYRTHRGVVAAQDRKGTRQDLPLMDRSQDVALDPSSESPGVFVLRRKLDTGDRLASAQPPTRTLLTTASYAAQFGWAHGVKVAYYAFGNGPTFGTASSTRASTIYVMQNATGTLARTFQRDMVDLVPGQPGYSDWFQVVRVTVPADFEGPEIRSVADLPAEWDQVQTLERINCPIVADGSTVNTNAVAERALWFRGTLQKCFQFPEANAGSGVPQRAIILVSNQTNVTVEVLFDTTMDDQNFSPFVMASVAFVPASYVPGRWTSIDLFIAADEYFVQPLQEHLNYPMVSPNSITEVDTNAPAAAPLGDIDPAILAAYDHYQQLSNDVDTSTRVDLYWTYNDPMEVLDVMVIGHGISGYVAIGFSNETYSRMAETDIVMGYVDQTSGEGCVRTLYGEFAYGAASSTPTLLVRNARLSMASGAVVLRFERSFRGNAHGAGIIPRISEGATSRITYATLRGAVTENCTSQNYANLYHGTSPHGETTVNWLGSTTQAPAVATLSPGGGISLQQFRLTRTELLFRGWGVPAYCAPIDVPAPAAGSDVIGTPTMYFVLHETTGATLQAPVAETYASRAGYTGLWHLVYLRVPAAVAADWTAVTTAAAVASLGLPNSTNGTYWNCPAVSADTSVEPRDAVSNFSHKVLWFDGDSHHCMLFEEFLGAPPTLDVHWNVSTQALDVIDSITKSFRLFKNVMPSADQAAGTEHRGAEGVAELPTFDTGRVKNCAVLKLEEAAARAGTQAQPAPTSYSTQQGFFGGRSVTFFRVQSAQRFANRDEVHYNNIYTLRNGNTLAAAAFQPEYVAAVATGMGTYSDIWRVWIVDATTATGQVTDMTFINALPATAKVETDVYFNCPIIPGGANVFTGLASVTTKTIFVNGEAFTCANFGMVPPPPARLPTAYDVFTSAGANVENGDVLSAMPGMASFYPLQWVVKATLTNTVPVGLHSTEVLNTTAHTETELYQVWNVYVISVAEGTAETSTQGRMVITSGDILERVSDDVHAVMAPPQALELSTVAVPRTMSSFATLFVFRRGLAIDTDAVPLQSPVVSVAPGMVGYSASAGTTGYTDVQTVVIIRVPDNFTEVLRDASTIEQRVTAGLLGRNSSTGLHAHFFVNVNDSAVTASGVSCPRSDVHYAGNTLPGLACGFAAATTTVAYPTLAAGQAAGMISRDRVGSSVRVGVSLREFSRNLVQDFTATPIPTFAGGYPTHSFQFNISGAGFTPATLPRGKKYVFRHGRSLHASPPPRDAETNAPLYRPVMEQLGNTADGAVFAEVHEVIVVNVGPVANLPTTPPVVTSEEVLLQQIESQCWSLHATGLVEVGRVLRRQNELTPRQGLRTETVAARGILYKHAIVGTSLLSDITAANSDRTYAVVEVRSSTTGAFSHFVLPSSDAAEAKSFALRGLFTLAVPVPAEVTNMSAYTSQVTPTSSTVILFTSYVSDQLYTPPPQPTTMVRREGFYDRIREVMYYDFGGFTPWDRASLPSPIFTFRLVAESGLVTGVAGTPVVGTLPGHRTYNDLHQHYLCDVREDEDLGLNTPVPQSVPAIEEGLLAGTVIRCEPGEVRNMPVVHSLTTIHPDDLYHGVLNPTGAHYRDLLFDELPYRGIDFGAVTIAFDPTTDVVVEPRYLGTGARIPGNALFATAELMGRDATTVSPLKRLRTATVDDTYVPGTTTNLTELLAIATAVTDTDTVVNWPIVRMDSDLPELLWDDAVISDRPMDIVWGYGDMQTYPIEMLHHRNRGTGWINFFTGETDQSADPPVILLGPRSIQFGCCFRLTWWLEGPAGVRGPDPPANSRRAAATPTYAPDETKIVFEFRALTDVWCSLGISDAAGNMIYSDIILGYARAPSTFVPESAVFLTERRADNYTEPRVVADAPLHMRSWETHSGNGTGWVITMDRPLRTGHTDLRDIIDADQNVVWAVGDWSPTEDRPLRHFERGKATINFISGYWVLVPQIRVSFWYVAVLLVVILLTFAGAFILRSMEPGRLLWMRPAVSGGTNPWTQMILGEFFVLFLILAMTIVWIVGSYLDLRASRAPHATWQAFGRGAQFIMYFVLFPLPHTNLALHALGSTFHRAKKWFRLLLVLLVLLSWVHGVAVLIALPARTRDLDWWAGIVAVVVITLWMVVNIGVVPIPAKAQYLAHWALFLVVLIFVHLHVPWTVFGMIPSFVHIVVDWILRYKDYQSRVGRVRSHAMVSANTVAVEVRVRSPWHSWCLRPFALRPGGFVFARFGGFGHSVPLCVSSRPTQEPTEEFALFSFHVRATTSDVAIGRNAADSPDHASVSNFPQWLVAECETNRLANCAVALEGPYGGTRLDLKHYRTLILVAGGIGIASVMPVLEALTYDPDYFRRTEITMVKLVWVVRDPTDFLMFASEMVDVLRSVRPFALELYLHTSQVKHNPIPSFDSGAGGAVGSDPIDDTPKKRPTGANPQASPSPDGKPRGGSPGDDDAEGSLPVKPPKGGALVPVDPAPYPVVRNVPRHPLFMKTGGIGLDITPERPNFLNFFDAEKKEALDAGEVARAVYVSGPPEMTGDVLASAAAHSDWGKMAFHVDFAQFHLR